MSEKIIIGIKNFGSDFLFKSDSIGRYIKKPIPIEAIQIDEEFTVETLEGTMKGKPGDYLIRGIEGEYYPCDEKIFEKSYDLVL